MKIFLQVVLITTLLTIGVFQTYAQVSCGATTAALTEPNGQTTLCSDGSDAVTLTQNPADNTSGLPDYAYVIESPNGLTILESGDAPLTISPNQFGAGVGDVIYVSGFAYDIGEFNDLIGTLSNGFICSIAGLSSAQCDYISDTDDQGGLNSLTQALAFGEVLGEVEVNKISESIDLLIGIDDRADALGGICVAISNAGVGYDYSYVVEDCSGVLGCTDACAANYNPNANEDDGSCIPYSTTCNTDCTTGSFGGTWNPATCSCINETAPINGCTNATACNFDPNANCDNGTCDFGNTACVQACNEPSPDDGCDLTIDSFDAATCTVTNTPNCPAGTNFDASNCLCIIDEIDGCTDPCDSAYEPMSTNNNLCDGYSIDCNTDCTLGDIAVWDAVTCSCVISDVTVFGCTDAAACNYDMNANCDDGTCDLGNLACINPCNQPNPDDGCDLTIDSFDASTCTVINEVNCPADTNFDAANCACNPNISGCTDACSPNYNQNANIDDGSCNPYDTTCPDDTCFSFYTWDAASCSCIEAVVDYFCDDNDECTNDFVDTETCACVNEAIENCGEVDGDSCVAPDVYIINLGHNNVIIKNLAYFGKDVTLEYKSEDEASYQNFNMNFGFALLSNLDACKTYNVRTATVCPDGFTAYSDVQTFQTSGCEDCDVNDISINAFSFSKTSTVLTWDIVPGGSYTLYYRVAGDAEWNEYKTVIPFVLAFGLQPGTEYEFAISVECSNGTVSEISTAITFETPGGAARIGDRPDASQIQFKVLDELPNVTKIENELQLYPNPAKDILHINYQGAAINSLSVFNTTGQLIENFTGNNLYSNKIDVSDYNAGIYFIHAKINGTMKQYKFIVDK